MAHLRIQHSFQGISGTAKDQFVNTFHVTGVAAPDSTLLNALALAVEDFYVTTGTGAGGPIKSRLAANMDGPGARVKIYNMADALPRPPLLDLNYTPSGPFGSGANLPTEVAICLSYEGSHLAGTVQARRRGRIYIGPWSSGSLGGYSGDTQSRPAADLREDIVRAAVDLHEAIDGLAYAWVVFSPTTGLTIPITRLWCDDAWDTQRRRGIAPTSQFSMAV